ncbi:MAG: glycosyltransferase family 2 protein [Vicinamibacteria bacterium]|jgi:glycosyltransferase involved in cell wall biosynthesis|nr:glycosyltransferase family 2 protein [Vicinamibacteria bacterium]
MISIVSPTYLQRECVAEFLERVSAVMDAQPEEYEVVFVDDGSSDGTVAAILEEIKRRPRVRLVELAYNQGKAAALTAGAEYARGEWVVFMDSDLQDPPESIVALVEKAREGFDLVLTVREERADTLIKRAASSLFWSFLRRFTGLPIPNGLGTMRVASRAFVDRFLSYREANRFVEGLFLHVGLRQAVITVPHHKRFAGKSAFNLRRRISLAINATVSFSDAPLTAAIGAGAVLTTLALLAGTGIAVTRLFFFEFQLGWPSLITTIIFGFGLNLLFIGVVGVYVGRIYREAKHRPLFAVRQLHNMSETN